MRFIGRRPWTFAIVYVAVSLLVEIALIVGVGWKVPQDNARIAPILLTLPPVLVVAFSGYRRPFKDFIATAALVAVLTVAITVVVNRLSGITTGLIEPIINRSAAGWLAAALMNRATARY